MICSETCELESLEDFGEGRFLINAVEVQECSGSEQSAPGGLSAFEVFRRDIDEEREQGTSSFGGGLKLESEFAGDQCGGCDDQDHSAGALDGIGRLSEERDAGKSVMLVVPCFETVALEEFGEFAGVEGIGGYLAEEDIETFGFGDGGDAGWLNGGCRVWKGGFCEFAAGGEAVGGAFGECTVDAVGGVCGKMAADGIESWGD